MPNMRIALALSAFLFLMAPAAFSADGCIYHPLEVGTWWKYDDMYGRFLDMSIVGERDVLGKPTIVRYQAGMLQTVENYWSTDVDGNLYLHGARNYDSNFEAAYDPPIKMVEVPLELGGTWVTVGVQIYDLDGTPWEQEPSDSSMRVYSAEFMDVPAGRFFAYGVGRDDEALLMRTEGASGYDVFGRRWESAEEATRGEATRWYAEGVGEVMFAGSVSGQFHSLIEYKHAVQAETMTWGRVKNLFH